jgi:hypothetical protein
MDEFLRPEVRAAFWRWREVAVSVALFALGLWWALTGFGLMVVLGWAVAALGATATYAAVQRLRFSRGGGGQGVVQVDEARVTYFGPFGGGAVELGDLARVDLDGSSTPPHWWLMGGDGAVVAIPVDAEGAEALLGAFSALPRFRTEPTLGTLARPPKGRTVIWERQAERLTSPRH